MKEEELPTYPRRGTKKIRLLEDPKPKVKVDKREALQARAEQLKERLERRKEKFPERVAAGRQSGEEDSKQRSKLEERVESRGDAYAQKYASFKPTVPKAPPPGVVPYDLGPDSRSTAALSSRAPGQGPKPPSGPPPKSIQPPPPKDIRKDIPAPPWIPQRSYAEASSKSAGAVPASAATSDAEILDDSNAKVAEDLCREYSEDDIVNVLTNALKVFMPEMGVWQALQTFEKPQGVIEFLFSNGMQPHTLRGMLIATIQPRLEEQSKKPRAVVLKPDPKWAPKPSYSEAKKKSAALFDEHAGSKRARVTDDPPPSNPEEEGSDSERTLEREQNEIAERQRALSAERKKKRKERAETQHEAEEAAAAERDLGTAEYLEREQERHTDSEDSSRHRRTPTGRVRNKPRKDIPRECDWPTLSGGDQVDGFLHERRKITDQ